MDIKKLSIEVSAKGVAPATKQLDALIGVASKADPVLNKAAQALKEFSDVELGSINLQLKSSSEGLRYLRNSTKDFANTGQSFKGLSTAVTSTATAIEKMVASTSGMVSFNAQLEAMKNHLSEIKASGLTALRLPSVSSAVSVGGRPVSSDGAKVDTQQRRLMTQIERDQVILEKGKVGWYEYRAAQLGVTDKAAPYIAKMREASNQTGTFTISARQAAAAARMLPAQFTDIATQLAGGQNPFLIMLQQGGQIKDMYQGDLKAAFRDVGGYAIRFVKNPFLLAAAAVAVLGTSFYLGRSETDEYGKSLALTNGYIGKSKSALIDMSRAIGEGAATQGKAAEVLNQMVLAGINAGGAFELVGRSITNFSQVTGADTRKLVEEFAALGKDPVTALQTLDKQYHGLSASTLAQVMALQQQGKTLEATQFAMAAHAEVLDKIKDSYKLNRGYIETFFDAVVSGAKNALDALKNLGREQTMMEKLADKNAGLGASKLFNFIPGGGVFTAGVDLLTTTDKNVQLQKTYIAGQLMMQAKAKELADQEKKKNEDGKSALSYIESVRDKSMTKQQRQQKELLENEKQVDAIKQAGLSKDLEANALAQLAADRQRILAQNKGENTVKQESRLVAEIAAMKQELAVLDALGPNYQKVTEARKAFMAAEIALSNKGLKDSDRKSLMEELPLLKEKADLADRKVAAEEKYKEVANAEEVYNKLQATITAQREDLALSKEIGATKTKTTEAEKAAIEWRNKAAATSDLILKLKYAEIAASYEFSEQVAKEQKASDALSKSKLDYARRQGTGLAEQQGLKSRLNAGQEKDLTKLSLDLEQKSLLNIESLMARMREERANNAGEAADQTQKQIELEYKLLEGNKQIIQSYSDNKFVLTDFGKTAEGTFKRWIDNQQSAAQALGDVYTSVFDKATDALVNFAMTGKLSAKDMVRSMLSDISRLLIRMAVLQAAQKMMGMFGGTTSAVGMSSISDSSRLAYGAAQMAAPQATGDVFTNSVVSRPKYFMGNGNLNVMGEAGPEAAMPLTRTASGDLGVRVVGNQGGGTSISVQVNVTGDAASVASSTEEGRKLGDVIAAAVQKQVMDMSRSGGQLSSNRA